MTGKARPVHLVRRPSVRDHEEFVTSWPPVADATVTVFDQRARTPDHLWDLMVAGGPGLNADLDATVVTLDTDPVVFFDSGPLPPEPLKLTLLVVPRRGETHEAVVRHWIDVHGPAVAGPMAAVPGALRYVASPARIPVAGYAGVTELWYADGPSSRAHAALLHGDGFGRLADNTIFLTGHELPPR
jgi:hypothetical protein